jgi:hypothetical protein
LQPQILYRETRKLIPPYPPQGAPIFPKNNILL